MDKAIKNSLRKFFEKTPGVEAVLVFGSHAKNRANQNSDVDVAILYQENKIPTVEQNLQLQETLSGLVKHPVDAVILNRANPILKHQIFKNQIVIINKNPAHLKIIFVKTVTEYSDLKLSRKIIEDSIIKRKVYG